MLKRLTKLQIDRGLILLTLLCLFLFLPSLFEPISYGDECIYLTMGQGLRKGLTFYRDIHDNKPPLLYVLAALSFGNLSVFRTFNILGNLFHLAILYSLIKKLTKNKLSSLVGGLVFIISYLFLEGRTANGEMFMMIPASLAIYLIFKNQDQERFLAGLRTGFLFAIGFLFKIPLAFDFLAIMVALYILPINNLNLKEIWRNIKSPGLIGNLTGFFTPILASIFYYAVKGGLVPYVRSALFQNIGYLSSWQGSNTSLIIRFLLLISVSLMIFIFRTKVSKRLSFFSLWFIFALFGALLSGRPYPHYLIEIVPALAILIALAVNQKKVANTTFALSAVVLVIASHQYFKFWRYPIVPYYQNFFRLISRKITAKEYVKNYWGEKTLNDYQLAGFIKEHTDKKDRIFLWGDGACTYAISNRLPAGRYTVNYHIFDFDGYSETLKAIENNKPKIIVKLAEENKTWPELDQLIQKDYHPFPVSGISDQVFLRNYNPIP